MCVSIRGCTNYILVSINVIVRVTRVAILSVLNAQLPFNCALNPVYAISVPLADSFYRTKTKTKQR